MIKTCTTEKNFQEILTASQQKPVFLMKHSTACGVSARAAKEYTKFCESHQNVDCWQVMVIENRALSLSIADQTGIRHKSPQVILFNGGEPVWHESHWSINTKLLSKALTRSS